MIEKITKAISALIPFLAAYPSWVRVLFSVWVLLSAVLLLALVLARLPGAPAASADAPPPADRQPSDEPLWLSIDGVGLFGELEGGKVKVTAKVNGLEYHYPSLEGIEWLEVGPTMSAQQFRLPRAREGYDIRFTMVVKKDDETVRMVSQSTDHFSTTPFRGRYRLHRVGEENTRMPSVGAEIEYSAKE